MAQGGSIGVVGAAAALYPLPNRINEDRPFPPNPSLFFVATACKLCEEKVKQTMSTC